MKNLLCAMMGVMLCSWSRAESVDTILKPGERVGGIVLGMARAQVMRLLGTPSREVDMETTAPELMRIHEGHPLRNGEPIQDFTGVIRDDWVTPLPLPKTDGSVQYMADFLVVYFKDRRVIQIEVRGKDIHLANGLSTHSSAENFAAVYSGATEATWLFKHSSSGGWPAAKHYITFDDAKEQGLAWKYGGMGNLAPDPDPKGELETLIIHRPGATLLIDPDGDSRFIWKDPPLRAPDNER